MNPADALAKHGLLLLQDKELPNAVTVITGERVSGSWWSHPRSHEIFRTLEELDEIALATKLIGRKVTYVHKKLWPALAAVGGAREPWQMRGLSPAAEKLLARLDRQGSVQARGAPSKELQERLLVRAREVHTESGRHETILEPWGTSRLTAAEGRRRLEEAAAAIGAGLDALPWRHVRRRS
jgi:hypothetical protein